MMCQLTAQVLETLFKLSNTKLFRLTAALSVTQIHSKETIIGFKTLFKIRFLEGWRPAQTVLALTQATQINSAGDSNYLLVIII